MLKPARQSGALIVLSGTWAFVCVACSNINPTQHSSEPTKPVSTDSASVSALPVAGTVERALPSTPAALPMCRDMLCNSSANPPVSTVYEQALDSAQSAITISESAQSVDDWNLVVRRWQEAIALLKTVPVSSPKKAIAKNKISEFQRHLAYAQTQVARPAPSPRLPITVATIPMTQTLAPRKIVKPLPPLPNVTSNTPPSVVTQTPISSSSDATTQHVFQVPVKRRQGGVPVIDVLFNGTHTFEMIMDTGASSTLITQEMAEALSLVPQGKAKAKTASGAVVEFPLSNVKSVEVGGTVAKDLVVAIGGPEVEIGLLGHDFFGNYDVTIKQDVVEFRER